MGNMNERFDTILDEKRQVRFHCKVSLIMAIERYMQQKGVTKGKAIESFLLGSETLKNIMEEVEKEHFY